MPSISRLVREFWSKMKIDQAEWGLRPDIAPDLISQQLEERRVLTVGLSALSPISGTANSSGGWNCYDPTVTGVIDGVESDHTTQIDFDFDGDGVVDDSRSLAAGASTFEYDPRSLDPGLLGAVNLRVKATEFDVDGVTALDSTSWESVLLNVSDPKPVISGLSFDHLSGDSYVLSGHVTGAYIVGAGVSITGPISDTAVIDSNGNFSCTQSLPTGADGVLNVSVTDTQGNTGSDYILVDVDDPTPTVWANYSNTSGDEYTFFGNVSGSYPAGATVSFSGPFVATVTTDSNGNFSCTQSFPTGANGLLIVSVADIHGHINSSWVGVDILDPTEGQ